MNTTSAPLRLSLVTGASGGLGSAISRRLANRGDTVLIHYHESTAAAESLYEEIISAGGKAELLKADLSDRRSTEAMFAAITHNHGRLDVLVNNAGITRDKPLVRMGEDDWHEVLDTNLTGTWRCCKLATRLLRKGDCGAIVNIGSSGTFHGNPGQANYQASKGGVTGMVRSLARELGPWQIRVNAVVPGFMETGMTSHLPAGHLSRIVEETPLGRLTTPEDVAGAVDFFTSPAANGITGQIMVVDGGRI